MPHLADTSPLQSESTQVFPSTSNSGFTPRGSMEIGCEQNFRLLGHSVECLTTPPLPW
jgi:hypothetical protein